MPGHAVIGYATKSPGITIHRADCPNFAKTKRDPSRMIAASWDGEDHIEIGMRVTTGQRPNMLADITNAIRPMNISITRAQFHPGENGKSLFEFVFEAPDRDSVARVAATLKQVPGVTEVQSVPMSAFSLMKVS
jgi:GTP pyrophosphokinase